MIFTETFFDEFASFNVQAVSSATETFFDEFVSFNVQAVSATTETFFDEFINWLDYQGEPILITYVPIYLSKHYFLSKHINYFRKQ